MQPCLHPSVQRLIQEDKGYRGCSFTARKSLRCASQTFCLPCPSDSQSSSGLGESLSSHRQPEAARLNAQVTTRPWSKALLILAAVLSESHAFMPSLGQCQPCHARVECGVEFKHKSQQLRTKQPSKGWHLEAVGKQKREINCTTAKPASSTASNCNSTAGPRGFCTGSVQGKGF